MKVGGASGWLKVLWRMFVGFILRAAARQKAEVLVATVRTATEGYFQDH